MFEKSIQSALAGASSVTDLVSSRIRPLIATQTDPRPYLAYLITDRSDPSPTHDGPSIFKIASYDVLAVAETYAACAELSEAVRDTLHGKDGFSSDGVLVVWTRFQDDTDIEQRMIPGSETPLYVRSQTFRAMYRNNS